jgi:hypothetical protein
MKSLIIDLDYFAPSTFYYKLRTVGHCTFDAYEPYRKMSFRNRCTLSGANGPVHLSVPLIGGRNQKTIMNEVRILNAESWQERHWRTITSAYNKSPWLDHYRDDLEKLYSTKFDLLFEWNLACFKWVSDKMSIRTPVSLSEKFVENYPPDEVEDWRNRLLPSTINRLNPEPSRYPQVFEDRFGFIPNLSILDQLFCVGNRL